MDTNMLQLYAVTDSQWLKEGQTLAEAVEAAIKGGVTMVQLREKHLDDEAFIALAKDVKKENTLTQALSDMLIDKVLVYPDKRIDVIWKMQDFCRDIDMTEMS